MELPYFSRPIHTNHAGHFLLDLGSDLKSDFRAGIEPIMARNRAFGS